MKKIVYLLFALTSSLYAWDIPKKWMVFPTVDVKHHVTVKDLCSIPTKFGGLKGEEQTLKNGWFDLSKLTTNLRNSHCFWAFTKLNMPNDVQTKIGAGADWFLTLYVNGKKVIF